MFRECDLDDSVCRMLKSKPILICCPLQILKPMLHALLIPGTLSFLSVASNRRLKAAAFRLIGAYLKKVGFLQILWHCIM